ncbi:OadG family transporter subunit [Pseudidiomarina taiwanensis]|uniref:OadG family transporter subunit n=1 Tax=Pseudidiomarina taiwanensis TaxID=337250 RepID=UPI000F87F7E5|nr:OadG family transporter subunit [Pseudidiomarina taiwanensis]
MNQLFNDALIIMVTGMTVVFAFLSIVIVAMRLLRLCFAEQSTSPVEPAQQSAGSVASQQQVAIAAALHHYRQRHRRHDSK